MSSVTTAPGAVAEARRGPLENNANNLAPAGQRLDARTDRYTARAVLWHLSGVSRCRKCGRVTVSEDGSVQARQRGQVIGYAGLATCGSVWACPVCNSKIQARRRLEVGAALSWALGIGGGAAFGAYTLRHHLGSDPDHLWRSLSKCWEAVTRDKTVRKTRAALAYVGTIRANECTVGGNGWHPHLHPVLLFARPVSAEEVAVLHVAQFGAWQRAAARLGIDAPGLVAQDLHVVAGKDADGELADYFTKTTFTLSSEAVGWEMTSTQTKARSRGEGRTPWDLLRSVRDNGDADDLDLWHQWEKFSHGKRALTWTKGLRRSAGLDVEKADEDVAAEVVGTVDDVLFTIIEWGPFREHPAWGAELLNVIERGGKAAGLAWCDERGVETR